MNISEPFIRRPVGTSLLALGLFLSGVVAYRFLPVAAIPRVDYPMVTVSASLPGADPETIASSLATPLERRLGQIAGVNEMTSVSTLGGCNISLQFDINRKVDAAAHDVQAAINAAASDLPINLPNPPTYRKVNPADAPIMILALTSESLPQSQVFEFADSILGQKLSQVEGVSQALISGAEKSAVRVQVNPGALAAANVSMEDVRSNLAQVNVNLPLGSFEGHGVTHTLLINGQMNDPQPYQELILRQTNGIPVRLDAFGRAIEGVENSRLAGWSGTNRAVLVIIFKQAGANVIETVDRIRDVLPQIERWMPPAAKIEVLSDRTQTIRASVHDVQFALGLSVALVIMVIFVFLRRFWPTFIASVSVPLALSGTVAMMYLFDYSIDNLSLMAITISVGFVVDDAIVVIENVHRFIEQGASPMDAAFKGARQIGFTVVSMSLSLMAVFIPLLFMGGLIGRLFHEFAVTVSLAIMVSAIVSITLTPMLCSRFLKPESESPKPGRFSIACERGYQWMLGHYETGLRWVLRHQVFTLIVTVATMITTILLYRYVPKGSFPQQDTGAMMGSTEASQDISFAAMAELQQKVARIVLADPAVATVGSFIGAGSGSSTVNNGRMFITLKPLSERKVAVDTVIGRLRKQMSQVAGINLFLQPVQDIRVGGRLSKAQFQYSLQSPDIAELGKWSGRLVDKLRQSPLLHDVTSDQQMLGLQMNVVVNRDAASRLGVSVAAIDNTLYDAFGQRQVSTIYTEYNQHHVVLEAEPSLQLEPSSLDKIYVRSLRGQQVPLSSVATFEPSNTSLSINHQGQFPAVTISFNLAPGVALGDAAEVVQRATSELHMPSTVQGSFQGVAQLFQSSLATMPLLIGAAIIAVYIVLGMLYESLIHPLTILSTLPSAGLGALLAMLVTGLDLSLVSFIGIILLIGIVKKNAIMMIDFALEAERQQKRSPEDAIYQACVIRFRPIMMTTMAALLGSLPLAIGMGVGAELRRPLGIAVLGGLIVSQMLTLFTTPVVYLTIEKLRLRFVAWKSGLHGKRTIGGVAAGSTLVLLMSCFLSGCAVGPNYERPSALGTNSVPAAFGDPAITNAGEWKTAEPSAHIPRGAWWEVFGDAELNRLESLSASNNQQIAIAMANYAQARAQLRVARADFFPQVSSSPSLTRQRTSANSSPTSAAAGNSRTFNLYDVTADASWEVDLWGRVRREVESARAELVASADDLESAKLSIQAEVAMNYFTLRALDAESALLSETAVAYKRALELTQNRKRSGIASDLDVAQAETQYKGVQAQIPAVDLQRAQVRHALAVLCGQPATAFALTPNTTPSTNLPAIPVSVPSEWLESRPDIAAAERRMAAANANVGVATAAFYPRLMLNASAGFQSISASTLFDWPSRLWAVGPSLQLPIFTGGRNRAQLASAKAAYDGAVASYRQTTLAAFQDVEDQLAAQTLLAKQLNDEREALIAARRALDVSNYRYKAGVEQYLDVITAQAVVLNHEQSVVQLTGQRRVASISLIKALGAGWTASSESAAR